VTAREFFERAADLERARTPFALATVVKRYAPVSSHLGDRAIVLADGEMYGFVGGACSRDIVRAAAVEVLQCGTARLVHVEGECASEGAADVYVEPHLPPRIFIIAGDLPIATELARIAALIDGYRVTRVVHASEAADTPGAITLAALPDFLAGMDAEDRTRLVAVVASQGHYDEDALHMVLGAADEPAYVGLLASRRRAVEVFANVEKRGVGPGRIARVHNPAGIDIGARRPGEVAISILAEIVATLAAHDRETEAAT
jgi:xanthine dehydrogenase accessory factor